MLPKHHVKQLKLNQSLTVNRQINDDISIVTSTISCIAIEENGVRLRLNIVDTPGYGDQVNNENW
jgi:septin family protein